MNDPIHGQQYYLDEDLRLELYQRTGVMSFRVYQQPGEAVFIPAGCAHQVRDTLHLSVALILMPCFIVLCAGGKYVGLRQGRN
jgi:hypothetical protein